MSSDFAFANVTSGIGPYGSLLAADANGILRRRASRAGSWRTAARRPGGQTVANSSYVWHGAPDGGACFPAANGGWVYASNSVRAAAASA